MADRTCNFCGRGIDSAPTPWHYMARYEMWCCSSMDCLDNAIGWAEEKNGEWVAVSATVAKSS